MMSNFMEKKSEKTDDPEILHGRLMERQTKTNLLDTSAKVNVQPIFAPFRCYRLSVAIWWYILLRH